MTDHISSEHRSWNMKQIKEKDTKIEVEVRKWLFSQGFRFRKNDKRYPGSPDIVLPKYNTIVFRRGKQVIQTTDINYDSMNLNGNMLTYIFDH